MLGLAGWTGRILSLVLLLGSWVGPVQGQAPGAASSSGVDDLRAIDEAQWNAQRAAHLFERAGFGASPRDIE